MAGERRGDSVAAWRILVATIVLAGVAAFVGWVALGWYFFEDLFGGTSDWVGLLVIGGVCLGWAVVVLAVGLWSAHQVRSGRWGWRRRCPACGRLARERLERCPYCGGDLLRQGGYGAGPTWRIAEPGADLARAIDGEAVRRLDAGTVVSEVRRSGGQAFVATAEGLTGWLPADRLQPAAEPGAEGEGDGDGR